MRLNLISIEVNINKGTDAPRAHVDRPSSPSPTKRNIVPVALMLLILGVAADIVGLAPLAVPLLT